MQCWLWREVRDHPGKNSISSDLLRDAEAPWKEGIEFTTLKLASIRDSLEYNGGYGVHQNPQCPKPSPTHVQRLDAGCLVVVAIMSHFRMSELERRLESELAKQTRFNRLPLG